MIDMIKNGGIIMIPILLCGVAATFIIIERIVYFIGLGRSNRALMAKIVPMISEKDYTGASIECQATASPTSLTASTSTWVTRGWTSTSPPAVP